ncbi:MAG: DUF4968 domain-containing protein, partial [Kangiellaceae bacterium]|nr:DUF4968 domain-containing protein [Kangiellaceae bacterium]
MFVTIASVKKIQLTLLLLWFVFLSGCASLGPRYLSHEFDGNRLSIYSNENRVDLTAMGDGSIEVVYLSNNEEFVNLPSFAIQDDVKSSAANFREDSERIYFSFRSLQAEVDKHDLSIEFYNNGELLTTQLPFSRSNQSVKLDFKLAADEKLLGGGQRVLGMDRRGHRMPLYNRAHYGYETESNQMYFS